MAKQNTFSIPNEKGEILQYNSGDTIGNVMTSFGMDYKTPGKIKVSETTKVFFDKVTETDLSNVILGFVPFDSNKIVAFGGGDAYYFTIDSYSGYTHPSGIAPTSSSNDDGMFFDSLILISDTNTIKSSPTGASWTDWWQTTLGQSALSSSSATKPRLMRVGSDGNLYFSDGGNLLYKVSPVGSPATVYEPGTDAGTLDFSATNHVFNCMETTSTRLWIGTKNIGGEAAVLEWDMSPESTTVNRIHNIGAESVVMIVIYQDTPIAILSDGNIKIFNGVQFVDYPKMNIRVPVGYKLASNFVHRNGWDIIDGKPHIAISGLISTTESKYSAASSSTWLMPSGVYCMDADKGLYLRYTFGSGDNTRSDYAQVAVTDVGALKAVNGLKGKFLVSYESMLTDSTYNPALSYHNKENTVDVKAWLATTFAMSFRDLWKKVELFHKPLETGCSIKIYSRPENTDAVTMKGTWVDSSTFNAGITDTGIVKGNLALVKMGNGAGQWLRVASVNESSTVTSLTFEDSNTFVSAEDDGTLDVLDFQYMGTVDDTQRDYHDFTVPDSQKKRKRQFLFELTKPAGKKMELDYIIVNP